MLGRRGFFIFTVTVMLIACQAPLPRGTGNYSETSVQQRIPSQRTCWQNVPSSFPHRGGAPATFILAAGANTGELLMTNQDAQQFTAAMRNRYHVPNEQICLLTNVYRAEWETALTDLKRWLKPKDRVIMFFSGHGSYVKDEKNGDETTDGLDEVLVTLDVNDLVMPRRQDVIIDDRLTQLVNTLPTQNILTFIDACYSSGMYMGVSNLAREKFFAKGELAPFPRPLVVATAPTTGALTHLNGVLFAAAPEHQPAWEDRAGGIFTTSFLQELRRYPRANLKQIFDYTAAQMRNSNRSQEPQYPEIMGNIDLAMRN